MSRTLIRSRVMAGVWQWWDAHVDPDPLFRAQSAAPSAFPLRYHLPDGRLVERADMTPFEAHYGLPCRAILLED